MNFPFYLLQQNTTRSVSVDLNQKMFFFDNCQPIIAVHCAPIFDISTNTVKNRNAYHIKMKLLRHKCSDQGIFGVQWTKLVDICPNFHRFGFILVLVWQFGASDSESNSVRRSQSVSVPHFMALWQTHARIHTSESEPMFDCGCLP